MKILVIDDSRIHQQTAQQTLQGHDLTVVGTYDDAYDLIWPRIETNRFGETLTKKDGGPTPYDVVLTDLLMPTGSRVQKSKKGNWGAESGEFLGPVMPVGFALALDAVLHGAKYVAVVSDGDHHQDPALAMLDRLGSYKTGVEFTPVRFEMNGSHVGFFRVQHSSGRIPIEGTTCAECAGVGKHSEISCEFCDGSGKTPYINEDKGRCGCCNGSGRRKNVECEICKSSGKVLGKDWGKILDHLLAAPRDALRVGPLGTHTTDLRKTIASHHSYLLKRLFERVWMVFY